MICWRDINLMCLAKIRYTKKRVLITVLVSGMLFSVLFLFIFLSKGFFDGIAQFNKNGLGDRFLVLASHKLDSNALINNSEIQSRAKQIYDETVAFRKKVAKELGAFYDSNQEPKPTTESGDKDYLNTNSPSGQQALNEYLKIHPVVTVDSLKGVAQNYDLANVFLINNVDVKNGAMRIMFGGKEQFASNGLADPINEIVSPIRVTDESLMSPFYFKVTNQADYLKKDIIPIVVPYSFAEALLGMDKLSGAATPQEKLDRLRSFVEQKDKLVFKTCYRNNISQAQIDSAKLLTNDKTTDQSYSLPGANICSAAVAGEDKRPTEKIEYDRLQRVFAQRTGQNYDPIQQVIDFQVIGVVPDNGYGKLINGPAELLQSFFGSPQLGSPTISDLAYNNLVSRYPNLFGLIPQYGNQALVSYVAEFKTSESASKFIKEKSCQAGDGASCRKSGSGFLLNAYGSNTIAINDLQKVSSLIFDRAIVVVGIIAAIIMAGTFARIVDDDRREIAVLKAMGATRSTIAFIYLYYALVISLLTIFFALSLGLVFAKIIDYLLSGQITGVMQSAYGVIDSSIMIGLVAFDGTKVAYLAGAILFIGQIAILLALPGALFKNPIDGLKD